MRGREERVMTDRGECRGQTTGSARDCPLPWSTQSPVVSSLYTCCYFHILCGSLLVSLPQGQAHRLFTASFWARLPGGLCSPMFSCLPCSVAPVVPCTRPSASLQGWILCLGCPLSSSSLTDFVLVWHRVQR